MQRLTEEQLASGTNIMELAMRLVSIDPAYSLRHAVDEVIEAQNKIAAYVVAEGT